MRSVASRKIVAVVVPTTDLLKQSLGTGASTTALSVGRWAHAAP